MKEHANIRLMKKIKPEVYEKIKKDYDLRLKIASDIDEREVTLYQLAYRESKKIENIFIIKSFQQHTGWDDSKIFES